MKNVTEGNIVYKISDDETTFKAEYVGEIVPEPELIVVVAQDTPAFSPINADGTISDSYDLADLNQFVGLSRVDLLTGQCGSIQFNGEIYNPSWEFTIGDPIYINGQSISNVAPTHGPSAWKQRIGTVVRINTIILNFDEPVSL